MITGYVNINLEAILPLSIFGAEGEVREISAVIDTGYSGFLALPAAMLTSLGCKLSGSAEYTLVDGSAISSDVHEATILWEGQPRLLQVDDLEASALVGMALLKGYDVHIRAEVNGPVTITPIH